ncbi:MULTISPECIES: GNAT family N-acetyltransferase [Bacillus]|uniref:GNAT family N-acetyltransferase n=1 Tax=Bacillus TaxID=1386 RepID=UPI001581ADFB|nr:GNAT family N-acetyltransferase [Bacillus glycinifermentans]MBU8785063.1 GNAT family N-acetyltransferase [Bacillus glycinifermentans]NUJ15237.1 acetyltransferase [Bacillus glycinifermentans]
MLFQNGDVKVRQLKNGDQRLLAKWLSDPAVLEFYEGRDNPFDVNKVQQVFYDDEDDETKCIVDFNGREIGYIQFYQLDEEEKKTYGYRDETVYGLDQFIGETDYWNKGIGTLLVTSMVHYLIEHHQADRVVMGPHATNERALRCYEKCGFKKVRMLPKHEFHEGRYQDCWLIEYKKSAQ